MMDDETALMKAVCTQPDDDLARLVYADWLEEHEQPARAALIRHQIGTAKGTEPLSASRLKPEERGPLPDVHLGNLVFCRGFLMNVRCTVEDWLGKIQDFAWTPKQDRPFPVLGLPITRTYLMQVDRLDWYVGPGGQVMLHTTGGDDRFRVPYACTTCKDLQWWGMNPPVWRRIIELEWPGIKFNFQPF